MKFSTLFIFTVFALTTIAEAQNTLPPKVAKIILRGSIYLSSVKRLLVRDGNKISGSYFNVKSGRKL